MSRILNTSAYPINNNPSVDDMLVGTDRDDQCRTKNFPISALIELAKSSGAPNLQQVTDVGNTTTNGITVLGTSSFADMYLNGSVGDVNGSFGEANQVLVNKGPGQGLVWEVYTAGAGLFEEQSRGTTVRRDQDNLSNDQLSCFGSILGGQTNTVYVPYSSVVGGNLNIIGTPSSGGGCGCLPPVGNKGQYSVIGNGWLNFISSSCSFIGTGYNNRINGGELNFISTGVNSLMSNVRKGTILSGDCSELLGGDYVSLFTSANVTFENIGSGAPLQFSNISNTHYSSLCNSHNSQIKNSFATNLVNSPYSYIEGSRCSDLYGGAILGGPCFVSTFESQFCVQDFNKIAQSYESDIWYSKLSTLSGSSNSLIRGVNYASISNSHSAKIYPSTYIEGVMTCRLFNFSCVRDFWHNNISNSSEAIIQSSPYSSISSTYCACIYDSCNYPFVCESAPSVASGMSTLAEYTLGGGYNLYSTSKCVLWGNPLKSCLRGDRHNSIVGSYQVFGKEVSNLTVIGSTSVYANLYGCTTQALCACHGRPAEYGSIIGSCGTALFCNTNIGCGQVLGFESVINSCNTFLNNSCYGMIMNSNSVCIRTCNGTSVNCFNMVSSSQSSGVCGGRFNSVSNACFSYFLNCASNFCNIHNVIAGGRTVCIAGNSFNYAFGNSIFINPLLDHTTVFGNSITATKSCTLYTHCLRLMSVPTSAVGLDPGTLWNDAGTAKFA